MKYDLFPDVWKPSWGGEKQFHLGFIRFYWSVFDHFLDLIKMFYDNLFI